MTTLVNRPNTALLVVDMQLGVVADAYRRDDVIAAIAALVEKDYSDAFEATDLESVLADRGIGRFFLAGAQTDECIRSTLHGGMTRGYDVTLVADAHTTEDLSEFGAPPPELVVAHTNLYWRYHRAPGRKAGTVNAADVDFASPS